MLVSFTPPNFLFCIYFPWLYTPTAKILMRFVEMPATTEFFSASALKVGSGLVEIAALSTLIGSTTKGLQDYHGQP